MGLLPVDFSAERGDKEAPKAGLEMFFMQLRDEAGGMFEIQCRIDIAVNVIPGGERGGHELAGDVTEAR
jgi:hypothetical protein